MAVVIMAPPLDSCQTELGIIFKAKYEMLEARKSKAAGIMMSKMGTGGFMPRALYYYLFPLHLYLIR